MKRPTAVTAKIVYHSKWSLSPTLIVRINEELSKTLRHRSGKVIDIIEVICRFSRVKKKLVLNPPRPPLFRLDGCFVIGTDKVGFTILEILAPEPPPFNPCCRQYGYD